MSALTLYQFELCPYCHKVKSTLQLKGLDYRKIEVNPFSKKELPALPEDAPKKVPVIEIDGEIIFDSTAIMQALDARFPEPFRLIPDDPEARARTEAIEAWVDDELTYALPTVIYGRWGEAVKAAQVTARTSNFGPLQNVMVRGGGSLIMHQVAKRILKKRQQTDGRAWLTALIEHFEAQLGDQRFVAGEQPSLGDVATHGALNCIRDFPAFAMLMERPRLAAWFDRMETALAGAKGTSAA